MRRLFVIIFIATILITSTFNSFAMILPAQIDISSESGVLIDFETGEVLFEKNAHKQMYPASTTKIMTAILTLENANLNDKVIIDKEAPFTEGSRMYVKEGEEFTVDQLLHALLIESANDSAVALAKHISGSTEEFAKLMNKRAKELGALNTHFTNPHGLPDENHVTTAYDLAMIAKYGMTIPKFREIVKTIRYQIPATEKTPEIRYFRNRNRLLHGVGPGNKIKYNGEWIDIKYDIVDGIKTGYTSKAGQCLVSTAFKDNRRVISVVLKAIRTNVYLDSRTLIDYGFNNFKKINVVNSGTKLKTIEIENGIEKNLDLITQDSISKIVPKDYNESNIKMAIELNPEIKAPISKGEALGKVIYSINNEIIGKTNLIAKNSIDEKQIYKIVKRIKDPKNMSFFKIVLGIIVLFIIWRTIVTINRIRRKRRRWKW
ncbi:D-alanyl-D-alanine carboxypeptidase family protein [Paramaledivibacter caminithermalis]|jgi:D-alanyl-D-alanine carboxypeptidase (penicillin-binding protein 5/6)|uniref:serine-type D-Ala-D-Ala carboxypeptidase n=1 Tax=Paramaledivibacter caminithermalis (strain DSM 15212 / CIP 107654 / DViRD3) TaxID=1121301 RepID=A0A1M6MGG0_PARC5|nr:D-alanyl-D-alanine carboxypeptidase family protein [Paramaledivibacter caminithermalis]SHJ82551.1 D-alanyl-D-alanine carboxypeptidase (penicillin-binding protein 5/6) [Paramaledivibacter caminithermalis DSM 15212]